MPRRSSKPSSFNLALILASVILGFLLTVQFRSQAARLPEREQSRLATAEAVERLEDDQRQLKDRIAELRAQLTTLQHSASPASSGALVSADLDQQRLVAGLMAVHGPGIAVTLDDSTRAPAPSDDANSYIIHDYELRDVVSLLWLSNAEAIAINGERLVNSSSLYCVGSTILVNDTRLSPPYEIKAIGDQQALEQAVQNAKNLVKIKAHVKSYGVQMRVAVQKDLMVPAYSGNLTLRYARPTMTAGKGEPVKSQGAQ